MTTGEFERLATQASDCFAEGAFYTAAALLKQLSDAAVAAGNRREAAVSRALHDKFKPKEGP